MRGLPTTINIDAISSTLNSDDKEAKEKRMKALIEKEKELK